MGSQKVQDKSFKPLELMNLTPQQATALRVAFMPVGNYKGSAAFWDLDKAVNQPLVESELQHILGILDGRLEGTDLVTVTLPVGSLVGATLRGRITVPTGQVWYITSVEVTVPADAAATVFANWRCSLWPDAAATPDADGQSFWAAAQGNALGINTFDEFHPNAPLIAVTNKPVLLRLPAGSAITLQCTVAVAPCAAAVASTLQLYGYRGKTLVA